jgi:hypothetical protein
MDNSVVASFSESIHKLRDLVQKRCQAIESSFIVFAQDVSNHYSQIIRFAVRGHEGGRFQKKLYSTAVIAAAGWLRG